MKPPSKTKRMKKYMILFSVVLLFVVLSTVLAGYVGTKKVVDDIPSIVEKQVEKLPGVESLKISLSNISENQDDFNQGIAYTCNQVTIIFVNVIFSYICLLRCLGPNFTKLCQKKHLQLSGIIFISDATEGIIFLTRPSVGLFVRPVFFLSAQILCNRPTEVRKTFQLGRT